MRMRITVTHAVRPCYSSYFLRSRHGESAYIIEQGWNLVVNRPHFRSYLIGRGSFYWVTLNSACRLGYEIFGLWLSPWIYTWSYSEISAERSQAFWKRLYLCYSDSHVENPHFSHEKINVRSCELSNKRRPNLTSINTVRYALSRYIVKLIKLKNLSKCHAIRISYYY